MLALLGLTWYGWIVVIMIGLLVSAIFTVLLGKGMKEPPVADRQVYERPSGRSG